MKRLQGESFASFAARQKAEQIIKAQEHAAMIAAEKTKRRTRRAKVADCSESFSDPLDHDYSMNG